MAQTGFTPIQLYSTSTAAAVPLASSLTNSALGSELAINITDGKLFYKDNANAVQVIGWKTVPTTAGGTGLTTYAAGDLSYYASGSTLTKLAIGANTTVLTSTGSAPQWTATSGIIVGTATNLAGGLAGSVPYQTGASTTTFLGIGASGRYLSSTGTAPQWSAPAALTETDDTNVTLTLGGSPSTALLNAVSMTLGWTGQLAVTRGGTGLATVAQGDLLYGSAANTLVALPKNTTATRYLANTGTSNNPAWAQVNMTNGVTGTLPIANGGTGQTAFGANRILFANAVGQITESSNLTFDGTRFLVNEKSSYLDPSFSTSGGFNIHLSYSYNNGTANTIGGSGVYNNVHQIIYVNSSAGTTAIPVYPNGGAGVAWAYNYLDPDAGTWAFSAASSATITFTQNGTGGNTFTIVLSNATGAGTIQRTAGSLAYSVYVQRLGQ